MSTKPIRLVVSDVDGTLVTHARTLAPSTIAAAQRLRACGILLALVSSRPPRGLDVLTRPLGIDTPRAGFNGAVIEDTDGRVLEERTIPLAATREAVRFLEQAAVDVWVFSGDTWLLKNPEGAYVDLERRSISLDWRVVEDFTPYLDGAHKVMGSSRDHARIGELEAALHARIGGEAAVHRSQDYYIDVTHAAANKGTAACALARLLGIAPAEMACLGDMPNDLPMFAAAGLAIAMGNAPDAVKARAHAVTGSNDADGWAAAIDRFVLPRR